MDCNCHGEDNNNQQCHDECGCNNLHNHENQRIINLTLEDGSQLKCEVIVTIEIEDKEYIALLPEEEEHVFLYEYRETEEGPELSIIEDDNEFDKVAQAYNAMMAEDVQEE